MEFAEMNAFQCVAWTKSANYVFETHNAYAVCQQKTKPNHYDQKPPSLFETTKKQIESEGSNDQSYEKMC
jgi:hypothetical protein